MVITDAAFENEMELQDWVFGNLNQFLGDCVLLPGSRITTPSGKHGVPDGFAFNFRQRTWYVLECELLVHGVWPHIAEQITRYVVALQNAGTLRSIRDRLFEHILENDLDESVAEVLATCSERLLQQIEVFIESVSPAIAIFIDETNQDLNDFAHALDVPTETYRIRKFLVNGTPEYYSPDRNAPAIETTPGEDGGESGQDYDVIEQLGGGTLVRSQARVKCYELKDGRIIYVKRSKFHEKRQRYWYAIRPSSLSQVKEAGCTHFVLVLGDTGFVVVPFQTLDDYVDSSHATLNPDGTVRHYHVHISPPPDVTLCDVASTKDQQLAEFFQTFD